MVEFEAHAGDHFKKHYFSCNVPMAPMSHLIFLQIFEPIFRPVLVNSWGKVLVKTLVKCLVKI